MSDIITYGTVINKTWFERDWMACGHEDQSPKPLSFCKNIHPKSVVTDWRALMKASGSEGKV